MLLHIITLANIPTPQAGGIENVAYSLAAIASMVVLARQVFPRKIPLESLVTRADFQADLTILRDRIDSRFLNVVEKMDTLKTEILSAGDQRGNALHKRINDLESGLARVDERTRVNAPAAHHSHSK